MTFDESKDGVDILIDALSGEDAGEFGAFVDDYSYAAHNVAEFGNGPFMRVLVDIMIMNSED